MTIPPKARAAALQVGDKVNVYGPLQPLESRTSTPLFHGEPAVVKSIQPRKGEDALNVLVEMTRDGFTHAKGLTGWVHSRQVRRLRPKAKAREVWLTYNARMNHWGGVYDAPPTGVTSDWQVIHMREVKARR